ncbi:MAG: hypothetical protein AAGI34_01655 [Pseudomonadota bacterium]
MELISNGLLIVTALTAALYCLILARRLRNLTDSQSGIGAQIQALNRVLEETRTALTETRKGVTEARGSARTATENLAREVATARETIAALERAAVLARDRFDAAQPVLEPMAATAAAPVEATMVEDMGREAGGQAGAVPKTATACVATKGAATAEARPQAAPGAVSPSDNGASVTPDVVTEPDDTDDDIPDWPDGIIPSPDQDASQPVGEKVVPPQADRRLKVERMRL